MVSPTPAPVLKARRALAASMLDWMVVALATLTALWLLTAWLLLSWVRRLRTRLRALDGAKRSQSTRYGQIAEQFIPFAAAWPWDAKRFKFLGDPVDGVQFTDDGVVFVEIKTASSRLSTVQRRVRDQVRAGRVTWHEVRLE